MFRSNDTNVTKDAIAGLLSSEVWRAEEAMSALRALAYEETMFLIDELLGWHSDLVGSDAAVESALTRLMATVMNGDLDRLAAAIKRATRARRAVERAMADTAA
jgi:hypothetical protein